MCTLLFLQVRHAVAVEDCGRPTTTRNSPQGPRHHRHEARHRDEEAPAQETPRSPHAFTSSKVKAWACAPTNAHENYPSPANTLPSLPHAHCRTQPRPPRPMPQPASPKLFLCCATTDSPPSIGWRDQLATSAGRTQGTRRNTSRSTSPTPPVSPPSPKTAPTPALSSVLNMCLGAPAYPPSYPRTFPPSYPPPPLRFCVPASPPPSRATTARRPARQPPPHCTPASLPERGYGTYGSEASHTTHTPWSRDFRSIDSMEYIEQLITSRIKNKPSYVSIPEFRIAVHTDHGNRTPIRKRKNAPNMATYI